MDSGRRQGQSLVEMALVTPILIIFIMGLVEIGWYANNYMIMLEASRVGARSGTVLSGDLNPLAWEEDSDGARLATIHPVVYDTAQNNTWAVAPPPATDLDEDVPVFDLFVDPAPIQATEYRPFLNGQNELVCGTGGNNNTRVGFYSFIVCNILDSIEPLRMREGFEYRLDRGGNRVPVNPGTPQGTTPDEEYYEIIPYPDDIVVSVFAVAAINNEDPTAILTELNIARANNQEERIAYLEALYSRTRDFDNDPYVSFYTQDMYPPGPRAVVIGRYPTFANECNTWMDSSGNLHFDDRISREFSNPYNPALGMRDPFELVPNGSNTQDYFNISGRDISYELDGHDSGPEMQLGFVMTGQHRVEDLDFGAGNEAMCWGSNWTNEEIEDLMNSPGFLLEGLPESPQMADYDTRADWITAYRNWLNSNDSVLETSNRSFRERASYLPSNGVVLVEMFWRHDLLLNFPFFPTITQIFGDAQDIRISVWAAFPVPAVEPNIVFRLP